MLTEQRLSRIKRATESGDVDPNDVVDLLAEIERLQQFGRYIQHEHWCPEYHYDGKCTCGLSDLLPFIIAEE